MRHQVGTRSRPISRLCAVCLTHLSHDVPSNYVTDMSVALLCKEYKKVYMEFKESVVGKGEQEDIENWCSSPTMRPCLTLAEVLLLSKKVPKKSTSYSWAFGNGRTSVMVCCKPHQMIQQMSESGLLSPPEGWEMLQKQTQANITCPLLSNGGRTSKSARRQRWWDHCAMSDVCISPPAIKIELMKSSVSILLKNKWIHLLIYIAFKSRSIDVEWRWMCRCAWGLGCIVDLFFVPRRKESLSDEPSSEIWPFSHVFVRLKGLVG